jgi:hypothetical protein
MSSPVYCNGKLLGQSALPKSDAPQKFNPVPKEGQHEGISWGIISHIRMIRQYSAVRLPGCNNVVHRPMIRCVETFITSFLSSPQVLSMPEIMNKTKHSMFMPPDRQQLEGVQRLYRRNSYKCIDQLALQTRPGRLEAAVVISRTRRRIRMNT